MPFPRKVWIGLLLPRTCKAGYRTGSQAKQRPWKDDMPSFLTQIFQDWGSRVSCVLTRGWDKETQAVSERPEAGASRRQLFLCAFYGERQARPGCTRADRTWRGVGFVAGKRPLEACDVSSLGSSAFPLFLPPALMVPSLGDEPDGKASAIRSGALWEQWFSLYCVFPWSLCSAKQRSR